MEWRQTELLFEQAPLGQAVLYSKKVHSFKCVFAAVRIWWQQYNQCHLLGMLSCGNTYTAPVEHYSHCSHMRAKHLACVAFFYFCIFCTTEKWSQATWTVLKNAMFKYEYCIGTKCTAACCWAQWDAKMCACFSKNAPHCAGSIIGPQQQQVTVLSQAYQSSATDAHKCIPTKTSSRLLTLSLPCLFRLITGDWCFKLPISTCWSSVLCT